jgi:hypothetical protein
MQTINAFSELFVSNFRVINTANIVLLPKKDGAESITDFMPISLIHVIPKIIAKALARRLSPKMDNIVSRCQSAFIKTRSIHDNFLNVRNTTRHFHCTRSPALLIKLDIAKAFDSVRWDYILDLMQRLGYPQMWHALVSQLFSTTTSRVMLNGVPRKEFIHGRGLARVTLFHRCFSISPSTLSSEIWNSLQILVCCSPCQEGHEGLVCPCTRMMMPYS